jgi:hypothetical protein
LDPLAEKCPLAQRLHPDGAVYGQGRGREQRVLKQLESGAVVALRGG